MKDLTKITTPFGLLDKETQDALREYHSSGEPIECYSHFSGWELVELDGWFDHAYVYRALAKPRHLKARYRPMIGLYLPRETPIGTYTHADGHTIDVVSRK
jgi:hypothetical protein